MIEIELTDTNMILLGLVFGLIIVSPLICSVISEAVKGKKDKDDLK